MRDEELSQKNKRLRAPASERSERAVLREFCLAFLDNDESRTTLAARSRVAEWLR